jgi:signal transduction histidine kinase
MLGDPTPADAQDRELAARTSFTRDLDGELQLYRPVVTGAGEAAVVRARIPDALLDQGVRTAWAALAAVALVLILAAVVIADRLARSVTRDATQLSATARAPAAGDVHARADPGPTPELADAALALNLLADRIDELRTAERERVADLSHRLRTPLTALRLDAEASGDAVLTGDVERLEAAISELIHSARRPLHAGVVGATCDLATVARERVEFWSALAEDDGRPWTFDGAPDRGECRVALAAEKAAAAVDALVGNVFAHTPEGTSYALRVGCADGLVRLVVEDAGAGIAAPEVAVGRGATGGGSTGLGLDIARRAAEAGGGGLAIDRSSLGGAEVSITLPLVTNRLA